jgi:hypothetical protein
MGLELRDFLFEAPEIKGIPYGYCAKYARLAAKELTGIDYVPGHAWELGNENTIVRTLTNNHDLRDKEFKELLFSGETIVIFRNWNSLYNGTGRIGTHAAVYLGKDLESDELMFAQEYLGNQITANYNEMIDYMSLSTRQILAPKSA